MVESWCSFLMLDVLRVIFGEYNSDIVKNGILTMQKISRHLQIFGLRGLAGIYVELCNRVFTTLYLSE